MGHQLCLTIRIGNMHNCVQTVADSKQLENMPKGSCHYEFDMMTASIFHQRTIDYIETMI